MGAFRSLLGRIDRVGDGDVWVGDRYAAAQLAQFYVPRSPEVDDEKDV